VVSILNPFIVFLLFFCKQGFAQFLQNDSTVFQQKFKLEQSIEGSFNLFNVDAIGNIYLITPTDQLKKIKPDGTLVAVYNDVKRFGKISAIDVQNPLKLLIYYKNYSAIIMLDKLLSFRNQIELKPLQFFDVNAVANTYDNNIWIYDEQNFKVKKLDDKGLLLLEFADLRTLFDIGPTAEKLIDDDNQLYLIDQEQGVFIFDYYGAFSRLIPIKDLSDITIEKNYLIGFKDKIMEVVQLKNLTSTKYALPVLSEKIKSLKFINNKLYILTQTGLNIYRLD
jgi:hypothetical protein